MVNVDIVNNILIDKLKVPADCSINFSEFHRRLNF